MALVQMTKRVEYGESDQIVMEKSLSLAAAGNSDWVLVPAGVQGVSVTVIPSGGATAKVQTSTDLLSILQSGSGITAVDWPSGAVSVATSDTMYPVSAFRVVQIGTGAVTMTAVAQ